MMQTSLFQTLLALLCGLGIFLSPGVLVHAQPKNNSTSAKNNATSAKNNATSKETQKWKRQWKRQMWQSYQYQPRQLRWYDYLVSIFYWFLYSIWFWVLLIAFGLPYVSVKLKKRRKLKRFMLARMAELANPIDASARFQLGSMLLQQKKYRRALPYLQEAHKIQKEQNFLDPRLLDALADTLLALGKQDQAIELYEKSLTLDKTGGQGEVFLQIGRAYQEKKELATAEEWLQRACEANRSLAEPVFRLALLLHKQEKVKESQGLRSDFTKDAHALPTAIRKRNAWWVFLMQVFPLSRLFY